MNVLVATTLNHNPGDDFIRKGCVSLFEQAFAGPHNYVYYNRNPDLMISPPYSELKSRPWGNYATQLDPSVIDLVLIAGSPEWNGAPLRGIYTELLKHPTLPVIALGVGISRATPRLTDVERQVLSSPRALVTTRSRGGAQWFAEQGISGVPELPCPALFCGEVYDRVPKTGLMVIVQNPGYGFQEVEPQLVGPELLAKGSILTFHYREFEYYSKLIGKRHISYKPDPAAALRAIANADKVVSTRLHGAIAALANHVPACMLVDQDQRINLTCDLFPANILPRIKSVRELDQVSWPTMNEIESFIVEVESKYQDELSTRIK